MSSSVPKGGGFFQLLRRGTSLFWNATCLKCPTCGISLLFPEVRKIRRLYDWFTPLDGCPRCGYAYEREMGYFLLSIWAINYTSTSFVGGVTMLGLLLFSPVPFEWALGGTMIWMFCFSVLFARHSKAYFIAFDHLIDPHRVGGKEKTGEAIERS